MLNLPLAPEPTQDIAALTRQIKSLAKAKNAVILAHNYQLPEIQDVADFVGDSLQLSREAAKAQENLIAFCGVHFMAETASILSPEKQVIIPDLKAGCSLADSITAEQLVAWKAKHPGAVVVMYVNTSAAVKAHTDYCCTSSNATEVVEYIYETHGQVEILFGPDMWLGSFVYKQLGNPEGFHIWDGECHVHAGIKPSDIQAMRKAHPNAQMLIHPECGCSTQAMEYVASGDIDPEGVHMLSTGQMLDHVQQNPNQEFIVATENGMIYPLSKMAPEATLIPANRKAVCKYMKMITLTKLRDSLLDPSPFEVKVDLETAQQARIPIERMVAIG